jgi:hypothetical protein
VPELPLSQNLTLTRWYAPVDDTHTAVYSLVTSFDAPLDAAALPEDASGRREQRLAESMGPIQQRTREHLASGDKAIVAYRRMLLKAMDALRFGGRRAAGRHGQRSGGHRMPGAGARLAAPCPAGGAGAARAVGRVAGLTGGHTRPGAHSAVTRSA